MTRLTTSSIEFIDIALFSVPPILSYNDRNQKTLIRNHIIELIHDFPTFESSSDTYFHVDGTSIDLLNVSGLIHVSKFLSDVPIVIWVHEDYPVMAPMVFILSNIDCPVHEYHPFIDKSGAISPNYLNWGQNSSLCTLVHNLVNLFLHDHPTMPSSILKVTLLDDLLSKVCNDVATINARYSDEIEKWSSRQVDLRNQGNRVDVELISLLAELDELRLYNCGLLEELQRNMGSMVHVEPLTFEDALDDEKPKSILDVRAEDEALEDVMSALDKALFEGVLDCDVYIRQVRIAARKQFHSRAMLLKLQTFVL